MARNKAEAVTLVVDKPVRLDDDKEVLLAAGRYVGLRKQIGMPTMGGKISWTSPEYKLELTKDQLVAMGAKNVGHYISIEYDVSGHVKRGEITVA